MRHRSAHSKWIVFLLLLLTTFGLAAPVLADYLGPNRTRTTYVSYCRYVQKRCAQQKNGQWEWNTVEDWDCSHGDRGCSGGGGACNADNDGARSCEREEGVREETVTYDPATITGSIQNCTLVNGWCNGSSVPELALSAAEPLAGYSITLIEGTLNGTSFACPPGQASCTLPMNEGDNTFSYWALSSWGDSSLMGSTAVQVDTIPPDVTLSVTGTAGKNGWYISNIQVAASANDTRTSVATSGVASFEVSVDGAGYLPYAGPILFSDGRHRLQFRAVDNAGNRNETAVQPFDVDTIPPTVHLRGSWLLGTDVPYSVEDRGSGLAVLRIVIEDEDEKYAKLAWNERIWDAGTSGYAEDLNWNGQFSDKTVAPPGTYLAWLKASDQAGNEHLEVGKVIVPEPNYTGPVVLPTEEPIFLASPPEELSPPEAGVLAPSEAMVAEETTTTATTQTFTLTSGTVKGTAGSSSTSSGILWGAAAAAAIAAATTYALETASKRKEAEEAQEAEVKAQVAKEKAERAEKQQKQKENYEKQQALQQAIDAYHAQKKPPPPPGVSPEAQAAHMYGGAGAQSWIQANASQLQQSYVKQQEQQKEAARKYEAEQKAAAAAAVAAAVAAKQAAPAPVKAPAYLAEKQETPAKPANWWEATKSFVKDKIIEPVNVAVVQPVAKPLVQKAVEEAKKLASWTNEKIIQPVVKPIVQKAVEDAKQLASWANEKIVQPVIKPMVQKAVEDAKQLASWANKKIVQPVVKPFVQKAVEDAKKVVSWANEKIVQPVVKPLVQKAVEDAKKVAAWANDKVIQPHIVPMVAALNEHVIQPHVKPLVDKAVNQVNKVTTWVDEKIYQPVFAPVVNDINKYIVQPLAEKASDTWAKYGEWVHGSLDAAGFIPGFGEIADGLNGLVYLAEGRYVEASVSALAMIPILGDLGKAGKWGLKLGKEVAEEVTEKIVKEVAEEGLEKVAREAAGEEAEKAAKEIGEAASSLTAQERQDIVQKVHQGIYEKYGMYLPDERSIDPSQYDFKPGKDFMPDEGGTYDPTTRRPSVNTDEGGIVENATHETLHGLSHNKPIFNSAGQKVVQIGLEQQIVNPKTGRIRQILYRYLNEGVTEMFTQDVVKHMGIPNPVQGYYEVQVEVARALDELVGSDTLARAYFTSDLPGLRIAVDTKLGEGALHAIDERITFNDLDGAMEIIRKGMDAYFK